MPAMTMVQALNSGSPNRIPGEGRGPRGNSTGAPGWVPAFAGNADWRDRAMPAMTMVQALNSASQNRIPGEGRGPPGNGTGASGWVLAFAGMANVGGS